MDISRAVRPSLLISLTSAASHAAGAKISVTLDAQGGTDGTQSIILAEGESIPSISIPAKNGYIFGGYYTAALGGGSKIFDGNGSPVVSTSTYYFDTTLYAYWLPWYQIGGVTGSTTSYTIYEEVEKYCKNGTIMIYPASGHVIDAFSFDNSTWIEINSCRQELAQTTVALSVKYLANENTNAIQLGFEGIFSQNIVTIYLRTVAGSYSGLKTGGGSVSGVAVQATLGGVAYVVGADLESMGDDDEVIVAADIVQRGYEFLYWQDSGGNILSYDQSVKFKKSEIMDTAVTAVFAPVDSSNVSLDTDNS